MVSNSGFISQIQKEAGAKALLTSSYIEGLKWIGDPEVPISGIYLNSTDSSYSALRFLGIAMIQRPATPIYLLDEEGDLTLQNLNCLKEKFKIKGAFKGVKTFSELVAPLQNQLPVNLREVQKRVTTKSAFTGYLAIPITDFVHSSHYPFNIFVEDESKNLKFFAMEGSEVDPEYLTFISQKSNWLYIEESTIQGRKDAFHLIQSSYLDPGYLPPSWRTAETLFRARMLLNELRSGGVSEVVLTHTYAILEDVFQLVSQLSQEGQIQRFVEQAKKCDRTMSCVTFAILMCKKLRFEKNTIVESLGLASFFQDVSLYNSPWGNLAEVNPRELTEEKKAYYLQHPVHSADLVSKVTEIPDVTLQVIRQHHERIDRTGFPNRVGGAQLQPMAEILSLINAYLDDQASGKPTGDYHQHYSDRITVAFRQIITALEVSNSAI